MVAADCGGPLHGWENALRVAALNSAQLGIDPAAYQDSQGSQTRAKPGDKLQQVITQRRVEEFRKGSA